MEKININNKLSDARDKFSSGEELLQEIKSILAQDEQRENLIRDEIRQGNTNADSNNFNLDLLNTDQIYHLTHLKKIATQYRLRFLDSRHFKEELPYEALLKTKKLQKEHQTTLKGFKILAPGKAFKLKNADDPLLFAPIGNGYFYLIHKWGNDLSIWRKIKMWPLRGIGHMAAFIFLISFIFVSLVPERFVNAELTTPKLLLFAFMIFQWFGGLTLFYMIKKGKNFSPSVWRSTYINA